MKYKNTKRRSYPVREGSPFPFYWCLSASKTPRLLLEVSSCHPHFFKPEMDESCPLNVPPGGLITSRAKAAGTFFRGPGSLEKKAREAFPFIAHLGTAMIESAIIVCKFLPENFHCFFSKKKISTLWKKNHWNIFIGKQPILTFWYASFILIEFLQNDEVHSFIFHR